MVRSLADRTFQPRPGLRQHGRPFGPGLERRQHGLDGAHAVPRRGQRRASVASGEARRTQQVRRQPGRRRPAASLVPARSEVNIELNFPPKLRGARSRLYRRRFLQVNTRWKALAEIYTMHSFAPFLESIIEN